MGTPAGFSSRTITPKAKRREGPPFCLPRRWTPRAERNSAFLLLGLLRGLLFLLRGLLFLLRGLLLGLLLGLGRVGRSRRGALRDGAQGGAGEKRGHQDCDRSLHGASFSLYKVGVPEPPGNRTNARRPGRLTPGAAPRGRRALQWTAATTVGFLRVER